jgi:hypothetical protein
MRMDILGALASEAAGALKGLVRAAIRRPITEAYRLR